MQAFIRKIIVLTAIVLSGCAPMLPPEKVPPAVPEQAGHPIFVKAEQAFENGQYMEALSDYNTFLRDLYDDPFADAALFKIGKIFQLTGRGEDAMAVFSRLAREFPQGVWGDRAALETLKILFDRGDFESVVSVGTPYTEADDSMIQRAPFYAIIADAYTAMNAYLDAARYCYQAFAHARDDDERQTAWDNLQQSAEQLRGDEIRELVAMVTDDRAAGFLLYKLGMTLIMEEKYDEATDVLTVFVEQFPSHPDSRDAADMILSMRERSRFIPFTIGCVLPLSGSYGMFGRRALDGIEFAISQIGQTADGIPFQVIVEDSRSDLKAGEVAVELLDRMKVGAILGPMSISDSAAAMAQKKGIPIIVFTQKEGVTDSGPYVFRNFITPQMQVQALVSFAVENLGLNRFAVLYPDEFYGKRYMNLFWDQVVEHKRVVTGVESYDPEGTDFATPIKKLAGIYYDIPSDLVARSLPEAAALPLSFESGESTGRYPPVAEMDPLESLTGIPLDRQAIDALDRRNVDKDDQWYPIVDFDAIFIPDAPKKAGLVIPQLAYYDIRNVYLLGTNLWNSQTLLDMSGDYMKSTLVVDGFYARSQDPKIRSFVEAFKLIYDREPGIIEAVAYDSAVMLFQTMRQTATDSRRDIKKALLEMEAFDGVSGRTRFMPDGEAQKTMKMLRIQKGHFIEAMPLSEPLSTSAHPQG